MFIGSLVWGSHYTETEKMAHACKCWSKFVQRVFRSGASSADVPGMWKDADYRRFMQIRKVVANVTQIRTRTRSLQPTEARGSTGHHRHGPPTSGARGPMPELGRAGSCQRSV